MQLRHDMLAHGVNIVCAEHKGRRGGLAVAWATQRGAPEALIVNPPRRGLGEALSRWIERGANSTTDGGANHHAALRTYEIADDSADHIA